MNCEGCGLPKPADWCWEAKLDCPFKKPPRFVDVHELWGLIVDLRRRVSTLEQGERSTRG